MNKQLIEALEGMIWIFEQLIPADQCAKSGHLFIAKKAIEDARSSNE
jgi:hypothetical protein